ACCSDFRSLGGARPPEPLDAGVDQRSVFFLSRQWCDRQDRPHRASDLNPGRAEPIGFFAALRGEFLSDCAQAIDLHLPCIVEQFHSSSLFLLSDYGGQLLVDRDRPQKNHRVLVWRTGSNGTGCASSLPFWWKCDTQPEPRLKEEIAEKHTIHRIVAEQKPVELTEHLRAIF